MDYFSSYSSSESSRSSGGSVRGSEERDISGSLGSLTSSSRTVSASAEPGSAQRPRIEQVDDVVIGLSDRDGSDGNSEPSPFETDWLDSEVVKAASVFTSTSSVQSFVDSVDIFDPSLPNDIFGFRRSSLSDRVFHGQGSSPDPFFFMYAKVFRDSHLQLPFNEFSIEVLKALNVAPTQLHPNSWAYIRGFRMLCLGLGLTATPALFLHHYCTRPGKKVG